MTVSGVEQVLAALAKVETRSTAGAEQGVRIAADGILEQSNANAPKLTGTMAGSGKVTTAGTEAAVSYDTDYSVYEHEKSYYHHPDGEMKFLERAPNPEQIRMQVAAEVRSAMGSS